MADNLMYSKTVQYLLAFIVLVVLIIGFMKLFAPQGSKLQEIVDGITGLGEARPFDARSEDLTTASASVNALMWSINKVAFYDTFKDQNIKNFQEIADMSKSFKGTEAFPMMEKGELITDIPASKDIIIEQVVISMIDCWNIYLDKGKVNSACFSLDIPDYAGEITKKEITKFGKDYHKNDNCKDSKSCVKTAKEVFGTGLFDVANYDFEVDGSRILANDEIIICSETKFKDTILVTDSEKEAFDRCKPKNEDIAYSMKITNFYLPQEVDVSGGGVVENIYERWVNTYGDPEYVLYYEVFPQGEDAYWMPSAYAVNVGEIVAWEAGFLIVLDGILPGLGKVLKGTRVTTAITKTLAEAVGRTGEEVAEKSIIASVKSFITDGSLSASKIVDFIKGLSTDTLQNLFKRSAKEAVEESLPRAALETVQEVLEDEAKIILKEEGQEVVSKTLKETIESIESSGGKIIKEETGELEKEFIDQSKENIATALREEGVDEDFIAEFVEEGLPRASKTLESAYKGSLRFDMEIIQKANAFIEQAGPDDIVKLSPKINYANSMSPTKFKLFRDRVKKLLGIAIDEQDRTSLAKTLSDKFTDLPSLGEVGGKVKAFLQSKNPRHVVTAIAIIDNILRESTNEKFVPVGTNAFGLRTPFLATSIYDDTYTEDINFDSKTYEEYFNYYLGYVEENEEIDEKYLMYRGVLPEVEKYWISLKKENNEEIRFHLASPCKADLIVEETTCDCWGKEKKDTNNVDSIPIIGAIFAHDAVYQTGKSYNVDGRTLRVENFDGQNPMLFEIGENGEVVKQCNEKNMFNNKLFGSDLYKTSCIQVTVIMDQEMLEAGEQNYCYHYKTTGMQIADKGLNYALPIVASVPPIGNPVAGAIAGVVGTYSYARINVEYQWPSHGDIAYKLMDDELLEEKKKYMN